MQGAGTISGRRGATHHGRGVPATAGAVTGLALAGLLAAAIPLALPAAPARAQPAPAEAASGNPFTQRGVPAEATAENGVLARERALAAGRRAAWARLAAEAGAPGTGLSDAQIDALVDSIVIEEERVTPTRYAGRITVNFNPGRVRGQLGERAAALPAGPATAGGAADPAALGPRPTSPASNWLTAIATYRSMEEWVELQRRLKGAAPVASVEIQGIAVDRARLRLGLRAPGPVASEELAPLGIALQPTGMPAPPGGGSAEAWSVGLAGGG